MVFSEKNCCRSVMTGETAGNSDQIVSAPPLAVFQWSLDIRVGGGRVEEGENTSCLETDLTELEKLSTLSDPAGGGGGGGTEEGGGGGGGSSGGGGGRGRGDTDTSDGSKVAN